MIIVHPLAIFKDFRSKNLDPYFNRCSEHAARIMALEQGALSFTDGQVEKLKELTIHLPHSTVILAKKKILPIWLEKRLPTWPELALIFMQANPEVYFKKYFPLVTGEASYAYRLLRWAATDNYTIEPAQRRMLLDTIAIDPFYTRLYVKKVEPDHQLLSEMATQSMKYRNEDPRAFLGHLLLNGNERLPSDYVRMFIDLEDWHATYIALTKFKERGFNAEAMLTAHEYFPARWAYHFLCDVPEAPYEICLANLLRSPEWTIEYIVTKGLLKNPNAVAKLTGRVSMQIPKSVATELMANWLNSYTKEFML